MNFLQSIPLISKNILKNSVILSWANILCFFCFSFFLILYAGENYLYMDIFSQRDMFRSLKWLKGDFHWSGPEMSQGGTLPGPFFYFLLFPPLLFGKNIFIQSFIYRSAWIALSWATTFHFARKILRHKESLIIFLLFFISCIGPSLFWPLTFAINPCFALIFHILALRVLYLYMETDRDKYLYFLGLIIGLGIQVHLLVLIHLLTALIISLFKKRGLKAFFFCISIILITCLPYFIMHHKKDISDISINSVVEYFYFFKEEFLSRRYVENFKYITSFKIFLVGPFLFLSFLFVRQNIVFGYLKKTQFFSKPFGRLFILMGFPLLISIFHLTRSWYVYYISFLIALLFSKLCDDFMPKDKDKKLTYLVGYTVLFSFPSLILSGFFDHTYLYSNFNFLKQKYIFVFIFMILTVFSIFIKSFKKNILKICIILIMTTAFLISQPLTSNVFYNKATSSSLNETFHSYWRYYYNKMPYKKMESVFQKIASESSYPATETIKRIYFIGGVYPEIAKFSNYLLAREKLLTTGGKYSTPNLFQQKSNKIDGWFMVQNLQQFRNYTERNWKLWLSNSSFVSRFIREEIRHGKLKLENSTLYGDWWLISYKITEKSAFPKGFYNIGQSYWWEIPDWLKNCKSSGYFEKNREFYYCMILSGHLQRAGAHIKFIEKSGRNFMEAGFFGPLLGL